jgi:hypothetical protein
MRPEEVYGIQPKNVHLADTDATRHSPESRAHTRGLCAKAKCLSFAPTIVVTPGLAVLSKLESTS